MSKEITLEEAHGKRLAERAKAANELEDTLDLIESGMYTEDTIYRKLENLLTYMKN